MASADVSASSTPSAQSRPAVVAVCIAMAVAGINTTAIGVATRGIADELGVSLRELEWIMGAYLVTAAAFALVGGRMGDVVGRTRTFLIGSAIFVAGCLAAALSPGPAALIASRAVQGIGAALLMPASIEVVAAFPPKGGPRRGFRARGIVFASAFGIGPLIGGLFTDNLSWRGVFWFELALLLVAMAVAVPLLRARSALPKPPTRDFLGAALAAIVVSSAMVTIARAQTLGWATWSTGGVAAVAAVLAAWLVVHERRTPHPLVHPGLLRDRIVMGANLAVLGASIGMIGLIYFFNVFAQSALVFDSTALGVAFALIPFTLSVVLFSVVAGFLARRLGFRGPVIGGLGLSVLGFAWLATTTVGTTQTQLIVPLALCGIGSGIANAGLTTPAVMTERGRVDEAAGLVSLTRFVGAAIAIAIGTSTFLSVATGPRPPGAVADADPAEILVGGTAYQQAVVSLRADLRKPFEAANEATTVDGFAATMKLAAITIAVLTVISAVLLASAGRRRVPTGDEPAR